MRLHFEVVKKKMQQIFFIDKRKIAPQFQNNKLFKRPLLIDNIIYIRKLNKPKKMKGPCSCF